MSLVYSGCHPALHSSIPYKIIMRVREMVNVKRWRTKKCVWDELVSEKIILCLLPDFVLRAFKCSFYWPCHLHFLNKIHDLFETAKPMFDWCRYTSRVTTATWYLSPGTSPSAKAFLSQDLNLKWGRWITK